MEGTRNRLVIFGGRIRCLAFGLPFVGYCLFVFGFSGLKPYLTSLGNVITQTVKDSVMSVLTGVASTLPGSMKYLDDQHAFVQIMMCLAAVNFAYYGMGVALKMPTRLNMVDFPGTIFLVALLAYSVVARDRHSESDTRQHHIMKCAAFFGKRARTRSRLWIRYCMVMLGFSTLLQWS